LLTDFTFEPTTRCLAEPEKYLKTRATGWTEPLFRQDALYAFDLTPDPGEDDHFNLTTQGSVRLVLKFREALTENVTVIAYAKFQNVVEIDRDGNVIYDFAV